MAVLIGFIRMATPLSIAFTVLTPYFYPEILTSNSPLFLMLYTWTTLETLFFIYITIYHYNIQHHRPAQAIHQCTNQQEREHLLERCFQSLLQLEGIEGLRSTLSRWFHGAPFEESHYENIANWTAWAFFNVDKSSPTSYSLIEGDVKSMVSIMEGMLKHTFPSGMNTNIKCIRLSFDEVATISRPLIYYAVTGLVYYIGDLILRHVMQFEVRQIVMLDGVNRHSFYFRRGTSTPSEHQDNGDSSNARVRSTRE